MTATADPARIDAVYRAQRARLLATVDATTAGMWARQRGQQQQAVQDILRIVYAGQRQVVALVDAFMGIKAATGPQGLDPDRYTVDAIRGVNAPDLYLRPWGALGGRLAGGANFASAVDSAQASLSRLVRTDLQLSQTHAARDWMVESGTVTAYRRDPGSDPCELCDLAAQGTYPPDVLAAIHEHCSCAVIPLFGDQPAPSTVRVADDPEIGPRLVPTP